MSPHVNKSMDLKLKLNVALFPRDLSSFQRLKYLNWNLFWLCCNNAHQPGRWISWKFLSQIPNGILDDVIFSIRKKSFFRAWFVEARLLQVETNFALGWLLKKKLEPASLRGFLKWPLRSVLKEEDAEWAIKCEQAKDYSIGSSYLCKKEKHFKTPTTLSEC